MLDPAPARTQPLPPPPVPGTTNTTAVVGAATGVVATDQLAGAVELRPECVLYMPRHPDVDAIWCLT